MTDSPTPDTRQPRSPAMLWLGIVGPPLVWLAQFETNYALAGTGRRSTHTPAMIAVAVLAGAMLLLCGYLALRERSLAAASPLDAAGGRIARNRFMATLGVFSAGLFLLVTLAQFIAQFYFVPGTT